MNMRTITLLLTFAMLSSLAVAGRVKDMAANPEQMATFIRTASYPDLLQFVRDADAERKAVPDDALLEYAYVLALNEAPLDKQIPLSIDFTLAQTDMVTRQLGARAVYQALLRGAQIDQATRDRLLVKLKAELAALTTPSQEAYDFARYAIYSLMLLGDDAGLDNFLTDTETTRNLSVKDNWTATTEATRFEQLAAQYTQRANDADNTNNDWEKTVAAAYSLAKTRRLQAREVKPLTPTANLDQLVKR